jgi:hypothetical protein
VYSNIYNPIIHTQNTHTNTHTHTYTHTHLHTHTHIQVKEANNIRVESGSVKLSAAN